METNKLIVGKFGKTFGVHGWIKVNSFTQQPTDIVEFTPWFISFDKTTWKEMIIAAWEMKGENIIVQLPGITTPETAQSYTNQYIAINREQLPKLKSNEIYWEELIGVSVTNTSGVEFGKIIQMLATGSNDVLIVREEESGENDTSKKDKEEKGAKSRLTARERYIPYLKTVVKKVDLNNKKMLVDWDENF